MMMTVLPVHLMENEQHESIPVGSHRQGWVH